MDRVVELSICDHVVGGLSSRGAASGACRGALAGSFLDLEAGQTARDVVRSAKVQYVPSANPGVVEDLDTPEDYSRLLAVLERGDQA